MAAEAGTLELNVQPVTPERWPDMEKLFGPNGAYWGCWCMYWRLTRKEFNDQSAGEHRDGLKERVDAGKVPGILAYAGEGPVAWCSVAPRETHAALRRSRVLASVDDQPVWSITCFFVAKSHRRQGIMEQLIRAAVRYAGQQGASIVEAYPTEIGEKGLTGSSGYMGSAATFRRAGFVEVAVRPYGHLVMRYHLEPHS